MLYVLFSNVQKNMEEKPQITLLQSEVFWEDYFSFQKLSYALKQRFFFLDFVPKNDKILLGSN